MLCDCSNCKYNSGKGYCRDVSGIKITNKGMCNWHTEDISKCSDEDKQYFIEKAVEENE